MAAFDLFFAAVEDADELVLAIVSCACPNTSPTAAAALPLKSLKPALNPAAKVAKGFSIFFGVSAAGSEPPEVISLSDVDAGTIAPL